MRQNSPRLFGLYGRFLESLAGLLSGLHTCWTSPTVSNCLLLRCDTEVWASPRAGSRTEPAEFVAPFPFVAAVVVVAVVVVVAGVVVVSAAGEEDEDAEPGDEPKIIFPADSGGDEENSAGEEEEEEEDGLGEEQL